MNRIAPSMRSFSCGNTARNDMGEESLVALKCAFLPRPFAALISHSDSYICISPLGTPTEFSTSIQDLHSLSRTRHFHLARSLRQNLTASNRIFTARTLSSQDPTHQVT